MSLTKGKCEACNIDAPLVSHEEKNQFMAELDNWQIISIEGIEQLHKVFKFDTYHDAMRFSQAVAVLADHEDHHPKIVLEWGKVEVFWWTHKIKGLHKNDFICAAKTDKI